MEWFYSIRNVITKYKGLYFSNVCLQIYCGVNNQGYIQPNTLARQDIVITTYETLQREINYVDLPHTKS